MAREIQTAPRAVNKVLDAYSVEPLSEPSLKQSLMLELVRLDRLVETFYATTLAGDVASGILCTKISQRRSCQLGLDPQQGFAVTVISQPAPHQPTTGSIRTTLDNLLGIGSRERELENKQTHCEPMTAAERDELVSFSAARADQRSIPKANEGVYS